MQNSSNFCERMVEIVVSFSIEKSEKIEKILCKTKK